MSVPAGRDKLLIADFMRNLGFLDVLKPYLL
jgi:hypothetical protein